MRGFGIRRRKRRGIEALGSDPIHPPRTVNYLIHPWFRGGGGGMGCESTRSISLPIICIPSLLRFHSTHHHPHAEKTTRPPTSPTFKNTVCITHPVRFLIRRRQAIDIYHLSATSIGTSTRTTVFFIGTIRLILLASVAVVMTTTTTSIGNGTYR